MLKQQQCLLSVIVMVHSTQYTPGTDDKLSKWVKGNFEDRLKLGTAKNWLKYFFKPNQSWFVIVTICIISTLKLLRAIAISVHMLCLLHIYCTMIIAAFKTNISLCYELLEGTCHIREYAVSSIFLFADFCIVQLNAACTGVVLLKGSFPLTFKHILACLNQQHTVLMNSKTKKYIFWPI